MKKLHKVCQGLVIQGLDSSSALRLALDIESFLEEVCGFLA
jgi:hypothetical protein